MLRSKQTPNLTRLQLPQKPQKQRRSSHPEALGIALFFIWALLGVEIWLNAPNTWEWYGKGVAIFVVLAILIVVYYIAERLMRS